VMATGDRSGVEVAKVQPMKLAAAEGLEEGGPMAPFSIVPGVEVPGVLSLLATHDPNGHVPGINDLLGGYTTPEGDRVLGADEKMARGKQALADFQAFRSIAKTDTAARMAAKKALDENIQYFGYGHIKDKSELVPPVWLVFWSFRAMVGLGSLLMLLVLVLLYFIWKKKPLSDKKWLLHAGLWSIPCVYIAGQAGWVVAEVGRQPWMIQDMLPVSAGISALQPASVMLTFFLFLVIFTVLLIAEVKIMCKAIQKGAEIK